MFAAVLSWSYPLGYKNEIERACGRYGVNEDLVRGVIRTESGYRPDAVSRSGAMGLMQLMPGTAVWMAEKLGDRSLADDLFDPDSNITLGVAYLKYLLDKYPEKDALAAYNAGEGNLEKWKNEGRADYGFSETREYVKKVLRAKNIYCRYRR